MSDQTMDVSEAIKPRSDQLNADDLLLKDLTITITGVRVFNGDEQPIWISYDGDNGKPWKPCKSMVRVMAMAWGRYADNYVGKRLTLHRDPKVRYGGVEAGGIRITHMSDLRSPSMTVALRESRQTVKPYTVQLLVPQAGRSAEDKVADGARMLIENIQTALSATALTNILSDAKVKERREWLREHRPEWSRQVEQAIDTKVEAFNDEAVREAESSDADQPSGETIDQ